MNNPIFGLNKIFDNRIRLGVMSTLMVNEEISFNDLKQMLEVTDGNLATHLVTLESEGFIKNDQRHKIIFFDFILCNTKHFLYENRFKNNPLVNGFFYP